MKIVTIHPVYALEKSFFTRDLGQIGFTLQKFIWWESEVRCLKWKRQSDFNISWQQRHWTTYRWLVKKLWKESKNISLLHTYHIWYWSFIYAVIYKFRNPKGIHYIKLDASIKNMNDLKYIFRIFNLPLLILSTYIWYEDDRIGSRLKKTYQSFIPQIIKTTSGINPVQKFIGNIVKKNNILLCWRFGNEQKNNELLIEMLLHNNTHFLDWRKFILLWSYTSGFIDKLENLFTKKPKFRDRFELPGFVTDVDKKYEYFCSSKIFLHTANFEWDPNIQYDAMFGGCFMISTNVGNMIGNYMPQYSIFYNKQDTQWLYISLFSWIQREKSLYRKDYLSIQDHCLAHFTWGNAMAPLIKLAK